ncbi:MAG: hypothetical protein JWM53_6865 [bacterium]|nr:hypothetical protein [bacterium]
MMTEPAATANVEDDYTKKPITSTQTGKYFTVDIGDHGEAPVYRRGPFVLTFVSRGALLSVYHGPPWEGGTVKGIPLVGETFGGQLLIGKDEFVVGESESCLISGFDVKGKSKTKR